MKHFSDLKWWQIALVSVLVSAIGGLTSLQSGKKNRRLYTKKLKQAPGSPPGWVFAPAWNINNFFLLLGLQRLLKSNLPKKKKLLVLQIVIWVIFFSFNYIYFNKKSSLLAASWTVTDFLAAVGSFILAFKEDKQMAYYYAPLTAWTAFAGYLAVYQALYNPDPLVDTEPLLEYF